MRNIKVFFSWQSDTPNSHSKIKKGLEKACRKLSSELDCKVVYDESTRNEVGSPKIDDIVEKKIDECDVFVADITPVTEYHGKLGLNSNVMLELGRARGVHEYKRIVILSAKGNWETKNFPFDTSHYSIDFVDLDNVEIFYHLIKGSVYYAYNCPETIFSHADHVLYSDYQITKNIKTGKYLPDVFLDKQDLKEHLRYFADPYLFASYVADKVYRLNYYKLNRGRKIWSIPKFKFNAKQFQIDDTVSSFDKLYESIIRLKEYMNLKTNELYNGSNESYLNSTKSKRRIEDLSYLISRICLLTGEAGQGKTNFICDYVQNVLLKRHIPFIYINGYEIDSSDIEKTLLRVMCPTKNLSFSQLMEQLELYCSSKRKPVILVIDGLNENPYPDEFCRALVGFLKRILNYDFCKVIMTCRSEYLEENFQELTTSFENDMLVEKDIYHHFTENECEMLLERYFSYFKIAANLDDRVKRSLTKNLLLLRIFCEANKGKKLGRVFHIKRDELFTEYYETMLARVEDAPDWEGRKSLRKRKIKAFFTAIIEQMIETDTFFNVSLDVLLEGMEQEDETMLLRFLDENILIKKDLSKEKETTGNYEVVNFTYDAFRDYLLAHYIIGILSNDFERQKVLINKFTADGHQLKEGIIPFLFVNGKNAATDELMNFMKECPWYVSAFESYIWEVEDSKVSEADISLLKVRLAENPYLIARRLLYGIRWNTIDCPKLNIKILLEYICQLEDDALKKWVDKTFSNVNKNNYWEYSPKSERKLLVEQVQYLLNDAEFLEYKDSELVFEFYAYIASVPDDETKDVVRNDAKDVYRQYLTKTNNIEQVRHIIQTTRSERLKKWMNQLITM